MNLGGGGGGGGVVCVCRNLTCESDHYNFPLIKLYLINIAVYRDVLSYCIIT